MRPATALDVAFWANLILFNVTDGVTRWMFFALTALVFVWNTKSAFPSRKRHA